MLVRRDLFATLDGFDEAFPFYWEEADLCMRMHKAGWQVVFEPEAQAVHLGGGSSSSPALVVQFFKSLYLFYSRHYSHGQLLMLRAIVRAMSVFKALRGSVGAALGARNERSGHSPDPGRAEVRQWLKVARL